MEIETDKILVTSVGNYASNIEVILNEKQIEVRIDKSHLFNTLKYRREIVGLINKKLNEMVDDFISKKAEQENQLNKDR